MEAAGPSVPVCLVTACGSAPACGVIQALRCSPSALRIVGVDSAIDNPGRFLVDTFALLPPACDGAEAYLREALVLCQSHGVTHVFPTLDPELEIWAEAREEWFRAEGIVVFVDNLRAVRDATDKRRSVVGG